MIMPNSGAIESSVPWSLLVETYSHGGDHDPKENLSARPYQSFAHARSPGTAGGSGDVFRFSFVAARDATVSLINALTNTVTATVQVGRDLCSWTSCSSRAWASHGSGRLPGVVHHEHKGGAAFRTCTYVH
jgi:hypothetical protein